MKKYLLSIPFRHEFFMVFVLFILGAVLRLYFILQSPFPLNDGGMFYTMVQDLLRNDFRIPMYTTYNHATIPYAYSPLGFYAAAAVTHFLNVDLLQVFRFLPFLISLLSIPVFYVLTKALTKSKEVALIALAIFVTSPRSFESLILGGGLTRSFGFLFALLAIYFAYHVYTSYRLRYIFLTILFSTLCVLSHVENTVFAIVSIVLLYFVYDRSLVGFVRSVIIGLGVLVLLAPWLITVITQSHGVMPFVNAAQANIVRSDQKSNLDAVTQSQLVYLHYIAEPKFAVIPVFAILGSLAGVIMGQYFMVMWLVLLIASATRMIHIAAAVPMSILAAVGIYYIGKPGLEHLLQKFSDRRRVLVSRVSSASVQIGLLMLVLMFSFASSFGHELTPMHSMSKPEYDSMLWIKNNTPSTDVFLVISPLPSWLWFLDIIPEWFPALTERKSLTTVQANEWLPDFRKYVLLNEELKKCNNEDIMCVERFAQKYQLTYDAIYIPKDLKIESDFDACCSRLVDSLKASDDYSLIYDEAGAMVWRRP